MDLVPISIEQDREPIRRQLLQLAILVIAAVLLRVWYCWQYGTNLPFRDSVIGDSEYYDLWARNVASGVAYGPSPFYTGPLYPYLLGVLYAVTGALPWHAALAQGALGVMNLLLIYGWGRSLLGHKVGLLGSAIALLFAPLLFLESKILTETLAITLNCLAILLLTIGLKRPTATRFFAAGLASGAAALCRPGALLGGVFVLIWMMIRRSRRRPFVWSRRAVVFGAGLALAILPVSLRNYLASGELVLISTNAGTTFLYGNNPAAGGLMSTPPGYSGEMRLQQQEEKAIAERALGRALSSTETSRYAFRSGLQLALAQPLKSVEMLAKKVAWFFHIREVADAFTYNVDLEKRYVLPLRLLFLPFPVIATLALLGISCLQSSRAKLLSAPALLFALATFTVMIVFSVNSRYRAPMVPLLVVFAAHGVLCIPKAWPRWGWRRRTVVALLATAILGVSFLEFPLPRIPVDTLGNLGAAYAAAGKFETGLPVLEEARRLDPENPRVHFNIGLLYLETGKMVEAAGAFREVVRIQPRNIAAHKRLVAALLAAGESAEAKREIELVRRLEGRL